MKTKIYYILLTSLIIVGIAYAAQQAVVETDTREEAWTKETANNAEKITGPASATDGNIITFDGTTGKLGKDSGATIDSNGLTLPAVAIPTDSFKSSDSLDADKTVAEIKAEVTTATAGAVVSDVTITYKDGSDASGATTDAIIIDGSDNQVEFQIDTTLQTGDITELEIQPKTAEALGTTAGVLEIDYALYDNGIFPIFTATENFTVTVTNWPATGSYASLKINVIDGDAYTGTIVGKTLTFATNDELVGLISVDGGSTFKALVGTLE